MSKARIYRSTQTERFGMPVLDIDRPAPVEAQPVGPDPEDVEREAYEKGLAAGEKAGRTLYEQKAAGLLESIGQLISELEIVKAKALKELEPQVLDLCRAVAERIVMEELSLRPELIVSMVKEAMRKIERTGPITIKLHPDIQELFMRLKPDLLEVHSDIIFDIDPSLSQTGQVVIGAAEEVVTDIGSQLQNIMEDIGAHEGTR